MGGGHCSPVRTEQQAAEQGWRVGAVLPAAHPRALLQDCVRTVPQFPWDNASVLARVRRALVHRLTEKGAVDQQLVYGALVKGAAGLRQ